MNSAEKNTQASDSVDKPQPFILKMGGKQWLIGDSVIPKELDEIESENSVHIHGPLRGRIILPNVIRSMVSPVRKYLGRVLDRLVFLHEATQTNPSQAQPKARRETLFTPMRPLRRAASRSMQDTFQLGLTFGLVLGCLSLILFHQLTVSYPSQNQQTIGYGGLSTTTAGFLVPATHLFVQEVGPFTKPGDASPLLQLLSKEKHPGVLVEAKGNYYIWSQLSVHVSRLKPLKLPSTSSSVQSKIIQVRWQPTEVAAMRSATASNLSATSTWLDTSVSAITALIAVESNGANSQDAMTAYRTAKSKRPSKEVLMQTGYFSRFDKFQQNIDYAFQFYNQHNYVSSMKSLGQALAILQNFTYKSS
jgi:hypothetical protein